MTVKKQSARNGAARQRLLEGVLLRLAHSAAVEHFVLRGGMLMRTWFHSFPRRANDLDLVCARPFDLDFAAAQLLPLLANDENDDGVRFDSERYSFRGIWLDSDFPGARLRTTGTWEGTTEELQIDLSFDEPLVPLPQMVTYPFTCGATGQVRACRPETILGRKLHAMWHMGVAHWRPKDLNDIRLLLECTPLATADLIAAIEVSFTSRGDNPQHVRDVFRGESWWQLTTASARWYDFVDRWGDVVPSELLEVVEYVGERLNPVLEQLS